MLVVVVVTATVVFSNVGHAEIGFNRFVQVQQVAAEQDLP